MNVGQGHRDWLVPSILKWHAPTCFWCERR